MFPLFSVTEDDAAALFIEIGDPESLDGISFYKIFCLFDLIFNRQSMAVPAESPDHIIAFHGPKSWNDVLDGPCQ